MFIENHGRFFIGRSTYPWLKRWDDFSDSFMTRLKLDLLDLVLL